MKAGTVEQRVESTAIRKKKICQILKQEPDADWKTLECAMTKTRETKDISGIIALGSAMTIAMERKCDGVTREQFDRNVLMGTFKKYITGWYNERKTAIKDYNMASIKPQVYKEKMDVLLQVRD